MTKNPLFKFVSMPIVPLLVLVLVIGLVDWLGLMPAVQSLSHQSKATLFPYTWGHVISIDIIERNGSKRRTYYEPRFFYNYEVNGQLFQNSRFRYDNHNPSYSMSDVAIRAAQRHPPGSLIKIYYNPERPSDSLLWPGIDTQDVTGLFAFTAINIFLLYLLMEAYQRVDEQGQPKLAGGVKIIAKMMEIRVRLPRYRPVYVGMVASEIPLIIAIWAIPYCAKTYGLMPTTNGAALITIVVGVCAYLVQLLIVLSGRQDLVIKQVDRIVELPLTHKRWKRMTVRFADITAVTLENVLHDSRYGATYTYAPTLHILHQQTQRLADLKDKNRAQAFVSWLREQLGVPRMASR